MHVDSMLAHRPSRSRVGYELSKGEVLLVASALLLPIPIFALTGLGIPLPSLVERAVASLVPGGESDAIHAAPLTDAAARTSFEQAARAASSSGPQTRTGTSSTRTSVRGATRGSSPSPRRRSSQPGAAAPAAPGTGDGEKDAAANDTQASNHLTRILGGSSDKRGNGNNGLPDPPTVDPLPTGNPPGASASVSLGGSSVNTGVTIGGGSAGGSGSVSAGSGTEGTRASAEATTPETPVGSARGAASVSSDADTTSISVGLTTPDGTSVGAGRTLPAGTTPPSGSGQSGNGLNFDTGHLP